MSQCQACGGKVADAFICRNCQGELRKNLDDLPWWIDRLAEAAVGHAKLGDGGRRTRSESGGLVDYTDPVNGDERLERDMAAGRFGRDAVLAAGRVNARASRLLDLVNNSLSTIVRDLCESRGVDLPPHLTAAGRNPLRSHTHVIRLAEWLSGKMGAVSADEGAGQTYAEIQGHIRDIERIINRPIPPRFCGPCPSLVIDKDTGRERECGVRLMAKATATVVWCPTCKHEHDIERIINRLLANVEHWRFTREELIGSRTGDWAGIMGLLDEPVSKSAFHRWCKEGLLKVAGYRRPDGANGISRRTDDDVALYRLSRVRRLRNELGDKRAKAMGWVG